MAIAVQLVLHGVVNECLAKGCLQQELLESIQRRKYIRKGNAKSFKEIQKPSQGTRIYRSIAWLLLKIFKKSQTIILVQLNTLHMCITDFITVSYHLKCLFKHQH